MFYNTVIGYKYKLDGKDKMTRDVLLSSSTLEENKEQKVALVA
jgi:hypothetical protein